EAAGGTMADIVKLNYFLAAEVNQAEVPKMRPIRDRYLNVARPPASTFVAVSRLMRPGWMIEIEAVAAIGQGRRQEADRRVGKAQACPPFLARLPKRKVGTAQARLCPPCGFRDVVVITPPWS